MGRREASALRKSAPAPARRGSRHASLGVPLPLLFAAWVGTGKNPGGAQGEGVRQHGGKENSRANKNRAVRTGALVFHLSPRAGRGRPREARRVRGPHRNSVPSGDAPSPQPSPRKRGEGGQLLRNRPALYTPRLSIHECSKWSCRLADVSWIRSVPPQPVEAEIQAAGGGGGCAQSCVRSGGEISVRAQAQIHAVRRAEGEAVRAARFPRLRQGGDRPGHLPRHRQPRADRCADDVERPRQGCRLRR